jgi:CIC family chloride channel protein
MKAVRRWKYPAGWKIFRSDDRLLLIFIAVIVGICSGLAAIALNKSLLFLLQWLKPYRGYWWAFVLPGVGAALSSLFLNKLLRENAGHGVPEVIYSVSRYGGLMRFRSAYSRLISSCLTIGSGGSAGPEAPVVMSGASIGSNIASYFSLNDRQRITLVGCGAAAAISSIFNAPIAGMVFSIEVILGEWSAVNIVPIAIAAVTGTEISRLLQGNQIAFAHRGFAIDLMDTLVCIGLAVFCAIVSILLTRALRSMGKLSPKVTSIGWLRAALGGCAVGAIGLSMPVVLGEGYHFIHTMIEGNFPYGLLFVFIAVFAKVLATSLTLGWGGSGGIFAPALVIGSLAGITYHRFLVLLWPGMHWAEQGCFALLGMAGMVSGMLQAPLTGIFLIVEITGSWEVILPLIIVSTIATSTSHYVEPASFYLKGLVEKGQLLRPGTDARVLADLSISELIEKDCIQVNQNMRLRDFVQIVERSHRNWFPVVDDSTGEYRGMINLDDIRPYLFNPAMYDVVILDQIMNTDMEVIYPDDELPAVLQRMDQGRLFSMPVVSNGRFVGMISKATLLDKYRKELMVQTDLSR